MSDFERLKRLDIKEIHEKTYIPVKNLEPLLNGDFSKFDRLKAIGFVKIIEREFEMDLSDLKEQIEEYFKESKNDNHFVAHQSQVEQKPQKSKKPMFVIVLALLLLGAASIIVFQSKTEDSRNNADATKISGQITGEGDRESDKDLDRIDEKSFFTEENLTEKEIDSEENLTVEDQNLSNPEEPEPKEPKISKLFILPQGKIWVGVIYLDDYSKRNFLSSSPIELNASKDQLIVTGHGMFALDVDGNVTDYNEKGKVRFLIEEGKIERIDLQTFKNLNRGKAW